MPPSLSNNQINALITLLADNHEKTVEAVTEKLLEAGPGARSALECAAASDDPIVRLRARSILQALHVRQVTIQWHSLVMGEELEPDLETGAFLIAAQAFPGLDIPSYQKRLDAFAEELRRRLDGAGGGANVMKRVNQFLFLEIGFHGNTLNYYDPENSYINRVIDRLTGIPLSLSVIVLVIAKRLRLPIHGIGSPGHFLLQYGAPGSEIYIDAFNGGTVMDREHCIRFMRNLGFGFDESYLDRVGSREILARMIRNLLVIYQQTNDTDHAAVLEQFLKMLFPPEGSS